MQIPVSGILSAQQLAQHGISGRRLQTALSLGQLNQFARGFYFTPDSVTELHSFAEVAAIVPKAVFCLYSVLFLHTLTTQAPHEIWVAVPPGTHRPKFQHFPVRFFQFSGTHYSEGIETRSVEGVELKTYNIPKTIADLFRYRHRFGDAIAIEALAEALDEGRVKPEVILDYARLSRVENALLPHLRAALQKHD